MKPAAERAPCRVLVADPPWSFSDKLPGPARGAESHYAVLDLPAIQRFPLPAFAAEGACLFLWRVSSQVEEAYAVVRAWGFVPKSEIVWEKTTKDGEGLAMGMGRIVRGAHETCILATRGRVVPVSKAERTVIRAPRGAHSAKPDAFYELVERLFPLSGELGSHVELFSRRRRDGWICEGNDPALRAAS